MDNVWLFSFVFWIFVGFFVGKFIKSNLEFGCDKDFCGWFFWFYDNFILLLCEN